MNNDISFLTSFLLGLLGSFHCFGMCGGLITALTLNLIKNKKKLYFYQIIYNSGRILSYCLIGFFASISGILIFDFFKINITLIFNIFFPLIIIFFGFRLLNIFSIFFVFFEKISYDFFNLFYNKLFKFSFLSSPYKEFLIGMVWGNMPCGLVYSALSIAFISGSLLKSVLMMLFFGLGTLPAIIFTSSFYSKIIILKKNNLIIKLIGCCTIIYGVYFLSNFLIKKTCHLQQIIFYFS